MALRHRVPSSGEDLLIHSALLPSRKLFSTPHCSLMWLPHRTNGSTHVLESPVSVDLGMEQRSELMVLVTVTVRGSDGVKNRTHRL